MSNIASGSSNSLQGKEIKISTPAELSSTLDLAFDYRGDVSLHLKSGEVVEGYVFNRDNGLVQYFSKGTEQAKQVQAADLVAITFSGKDPADGKSYENWKAKKESDRKAEAKEVETELRQQGYL